MPENYFLVFLLGCFVAGCLILAAAATDGCERQKTEEVYRP